MSCLTAHLAAATATAAADAAANEKNKTEDEHDDRKNATKGVAERVPCGFYNLSSRHSLYISRSITFDGSDKVVHPTFSSNVCEIEVASTFDVSHLILRISNLC